MAGGLGRWMPSLTSAVVAALIVGAIVITFTMAWQQDQASTLAEQVKTECDRGRLVGPICAQAIQVAANPLPGPQGDPGRTGDRGSTGAAGTPGKDGAAGRDGVNGKDGVAGKDGADGRNGLPGKDGTDGAAGKDGADGKDGAPPSGWSTTHSDGSVETCVRDADSPAATPTYSCTTSEPPSDTSGGGLLG